MPGIKAVLFDMDGVLVDAREWHYEALNQALEPFGMAISREAHLTTFDGLPTRKKLEMLSNTKNLPRELHGFLNDLKQARTVEMVYAHARPIFHLQYALSRLKAQGLKLAVCSNSVRKSVELMMERTGLTRFLDLFLSNEDVAQAKPDPEIYLTAMARFGLRPEECLIVEDNDYGVRAARASGGRLLQVASPDDVTYDRIMAAMAA